MVAVKNILDPVYFNPVDEMPLSDLVTLSDENDTTMITISVASLLALIRAKETEGENPFNTVVTSPETEDSILLSPDLWTRWLLRGNQGQDEFLNVFVQATRVDAARRQWLSLLRMNYDLFMRVCTFIEDLRRYGSSLASARRIDSIALSSPLKFGLPYFEKDEANMLLSGPLHPDSTVREKLAERIEGKGMEVCASHDMAPFLMRAFSIDSADLEKDGFARFYNAFSRLSIKSGQAESSWRMSKGGAMEGMAKSGAGNKGGASSQNKRSERSRESIGDGRGSRGRGNRGRRQ